MRSACNLSLGCGYFLQERYLRHFPMLHPISCVLVYFCNSESYLASIKLCAKTLQPTWCCSCTSLTRVIKQFCQRFHCALTFHKYPHYIQHVPMYCACIWCRSIVQHPVSSRGVPSSLEGREGSPTAQCHRPAPSQGARLHGLPVLQKNQSQPAENTEQEAPEGNCSGLQAHLVGQRAERQLQRGRRNLEACTTCRLCVSGYAFFCAGLGCSWFLAGSLCLASTTDVML